MLDKQQRKDLFHKLLVSEPRTEDEHMGDLELGLKKYPGVREQFFDPHYIKAQPNITVKLKQDVDPIIASMKSNAKQWIDLFGVENFEFNQVNAVKACGEDILIHSTGYRFGNKPEHEEKVGQFYGAEIVVSYMIDVNTGVKRFAGVYLVHGDVDSTVATIYVDTKFYRLMRLAVPHYKVFRSYSENIRHLRKSKIEVRYPPETSHIYSAINKFVSLHMSSELVINGFSYLNYKSLFDL